MQVKYNGGTSCKLAPAEGLSKRSQGGITPEMKNLIGATEVTTNGVKKGKVKTFNIGDETAGTIGRAFDDEIIARLINRWGSGNFDNFPPSISTKFSTFHSQGYRLVINEPRLSINGQNFDPDILLVRTYTNSAGLQVTDIKYIDVKYLDDVAYNSGGQSAVKAAVTSNGSATVANTTNSNLKDFINNPIQGTSGNLIIISVEKLSIKVSDLGLIIH